MFTFQSTPSAWRETSERVGSECHCIISIHSLRMEGDYSYSLTILFINISIHSLRMEGDRRLPAVLDVDFISIHSLRMEGDVGGFKIPVVVGYISIHSLRMEGDLPLLCPRGDFLYFNPLPPHGGRRLRISNTVTPTGISIHSLRMEGDACIRHCHSDCGHFNPLPPHGGRRGICP